MLSARDFKFLFPVATKSCIIKSTNVLVLDEYHEFQKLKPPQVHFTAFKPECALNLPLTSKKPRMWCLFGHF